MCAKVRQGQKAGIEGWNPHQYRGLGQQGLDLGRIKAGHKDRGRCAQKGGVKGDEQAVDMEDRQGMEQHILRRKAPEPVQLLGIGGQVAVAEHRPLGPSGGARRIEDRGNIAGGARCDGCIRLRRERLGPERAVGRGTHDQNMVSGCVP